MPKQSVFTRLPQLTRWVLLWFALSLGAAIASPLVAPKSVELVCSGAGAMKLIVKSDDGRAVQSSHAPDCDLCTSTSAPPPARHPALELPSCLAYATPLLAQARVASLLLTQPPARGPPAYSGLLFN